MAEWRARVTPLLEEESYRKEFNIGEYGQRLLANFEASERAPPALEKRELAAQVG